MNFGLASLRELIEDFLTNSGGRRGRQREQRREESDEFGGEPEAESATDAQSEEPEPESNDGPSDSESDESDGGDGGSRGGGGFFGRGSSDDDDIDDLFYRIEELEEELQDKENELGSVQDSQQHVAEQVEEMNERVQRLLGVYDQVTDDVNPFTGEGEAQSGFGVFGEDGTGRGDASSAPGIESRLAEDSTADDETVSFDDLKGVIEGAAAAQSSDGERIAFDEDDVDETDDTRVEVQATDSVDAPETTADAAGTDERTGTDAGDDGESDDDPDDVTLSTLADTYATDIIVFEWLTQLVRTGGSAATLRAISYYAEIGWIGEDVETHLEDVLSGPDLDMHVDPGSTPEELTAEDHADSYTYIMKLREIHETKAEVQPDLDRAPESEVGP